MRCFQGTVVLRDLRHKLTVDVHGSVPKLLTVSNIVRSHAKCVYWLPGMSWIPNGNNHSNNRKNRNYEVVFPVCHGTQGPRSTS